MILGVRPQNAYGIMCAYMEAIRKSSLWAVWAIAFAVVAFAVTFIGFSQSASALWEPYTPDQGNNIITTTGNPVSPLTGGTQSNRVYHVLKKEGTSQVVRTEFDAYFSELNTNHYIELTSRINNTNRCGVWNGFDPFITVTMTILDPINPAMPAAQKQAVYNIPAGNICAGATGGTNARGTNNGRFFARYPVPLGFANGLVNRDDDTSLYRINMRIAYSNPGAVSTGGGGNPNQQVLFKVQTDTAVPASCNSTTCDRYIGASAATTGQTTPNIATLGDTNDGNAGVYTQQRFYFGLPCRENTAQRKRITVYDLDNGSTGGSWGNGAESRGENRARFFIQTSTNGSTWTSLDAADYLLRQDVNTSTGVVLGNAAISTMGGIDTILPRDGSSITTNAEFMMQPHMFYRVIISPLYSNNIINLGIPVGSRTIFGVLNCNVGLAGSIAANPTSGIEPIEAGRSLTLTPQSKRSGNTDFTSSYNYNFKIWYDTGDDVYNAADDGAPVCTRSANLTDGNAATAPPRTLNTCPAVVANPAANGGRATAICSQLILTRLPTDSVTNITTAAAPNGLTRCFHIGKFPHLEARNGDIFAGGRFREASPTCTMTGKPIVSSSQRQIATGGPFYTSYATYGVTSLGASLTFGSMGQSYDTSPTTIADNLVFANTSTVDGYFYNPTGNNNTPTTASCLNNPFALFGPRADAGADVAGTNIDISTLGDDTNLTASGTINLYASQPIPAGKKIVIYAKTADIKITSNITYADQAYASINQIPQVIVLTDRNMIVGQTSSVDGSQITQLDGIYAARVNFYTCDLVPRLHVCEMPLKVNGAVVVGQHTVPLRTAGADATSLTGMAETFNLRSDMFLNQLPEAGGANVYIKTLSETEQPPRF